MNTAARIQREVADEIQRDPTMDSSQIGVTVRDGVVALTGRVPVYAQKFTAEAAAKRVPGVRGVANEIEFVVLPGGAGCTDADIAEAAVTALKSEADVPDDRVQVTVSGGWITLNGIVDRHSQREAADRAVRRLIGAYGVTNAILLQSEVAAADESPGGPEAVLKLRGKITA